MINRAREIAQMMGYSSIDATLEAIGRGELILIKLADTQRHAVAEWLHAQAPVVRAKQEDLGDALEEVADGLDFALELERYPANSDICEMDLPHGWPSYCEKKQHG